MSWKPKLNPVTVPPRQLLRPEDWVDFVKRYMTDHTSFRTVLRDWTVAVDDDIATLEAGGGGGGGGGIWDLGSVADATIDGIFDFGSVA